MCFDAAIDKKASLLSDIPFAMKVNKLTFNHYSGKIGCNTGLENNFGCKDAGYGMYVVKNGMTEFAPDFVFDKNLVVKG